MTSRVSPAVTERPVDVVIPVYNAAADVARCVASVLTNTSRPYRLILIDDASRDPAIGQYFSSLASRNGAAITLLRNETNLGFTGTANRGMRFGEAEGNDVVLLNSDTLVTPGWLDAMARCAASSTLIGTITPFSNNAEICSFPRFCENNVWPPDADPDVVRVALARAAVPTYPELPTGVGFCLFVRRALLRHIGYFDETAFGKGYGEENDFCLRAFAAGWRNALCDDAFVLHFGARSFKDDKAALTATNIRVLEALHPHYDALVRDYIARDPVRAIREAALVQLRIATGPPKGVLHVIHGHGGGTEHHVRALIDASRARYRHYLAIAVGANWQVEEHLDDGSVRTMNLSRFPEETLRDLLGGLAATLDVSVLHLHNISGCRDGLADALQAVGLPYGYTVHDLSFACPTITFLGRDGMYCGGETDVTTCRTCLSAQPAFAEIDIVAWRKQHEAIIRGARFLIAPSRWAGEMLKRYFPGAVVDVIPHGAPGVWASRGATGDKAQGLPLMARATAMALPDDEAATVAVVGAIGPDKGARRLERLVELARAQRLNLRFVVIGYIDVQWTPWQSDDAMLTIHGRYDAAELPALLAHYRTQLVAYPSNGPETFSFTLSEIWSAGCPTIVPPFGALAERLAGTGAGWILSDDEWRNDESMLARIVAILGDGDALAAAARSARSVPQPTLPEMAERTLARYSELREAPRPVWTSLSNARVRDAFGYTEWWPPPVAPGVSIAAVTVPVAAIVSAATKPAGPNWRQRLPARALRRVLPAWLIAALKARSR